MEKDIYSRTKIILGSENVEKLKKCHVAIFGIGGVGSYVLESLARTGIGTFTIVDKDLVDVTNINRQIIALNSTIGMRKVDVAKKRVEDINREVVVNAFFENVGYENIEKFNLEDFDYVVDCVDDIGAKVAIIKSCYEKNVKCISSMGMANKLNPLEIKVSDIYKTNTCPLARLMRKRLKEEGIKKQKVVFSTELPVRPKEKVENVLGSISFVPSCAGLVISSEIVKDILNIQNI